MSRFRQKQKHEVPGLNLAAMPDLIFTVLFFFMIVTHMRDVKPMVRFTIPQGTEVEKARQAGLEPGTPVIDLTGLSPGILYILGAEPPADGGVDSC